MEKSEQELLPGGCRAQVPASAGAAPGAAAEMRSMLEEVAREFDSLDLLQRTLLSGMIRQQAGMSVDEWVQAAESLETLIQVIRQDQGGDADRRERILPKLVEWKGKLERLASCFQTAARLAGDYIKDPGELAGSLDVLAQREQAVHKVIREIEQLERS